MIVKIIDGNSISVKSEEPDDMVALRRAISVGDRIAGSTSREIKKERESIRPEKGQRVRIRISLESKKITLDGSLNRLKIAGTIAGELFKLKKLIKKNIKDKNLIKDASHNLIKKFNIKIEYLECRNLINLSKKIKKHNFKLFVAYYLNGIRLIDNF